MKQELIEAHDNLNETSIVEISHTEEERKPVNFSKKQYERPIVHRNVGKISLQAFHRRQMLSTCHGHHFRSQPNYMVLDGAASASNAQEVQLNPSMAADQSISVSSDDEETSANANGGGTINEVAAEVVITQPNSEQQQEQNVTTGEFCSICVQYYSNRTQLRKHYKTKKHLENLLKQGYPSTYIML